MRVPAGQTKPLVVTEERDEFHRWELSSSNDETIRMLMTQPVISPKVKGMLEQAMKLRWQAQKTSVELADLRRQLKVIEDDQARLRANLDKTPSTAAVYKKYLKKLDDQEEQIEKLQEKIEAQEKVALGHRKALDDYIAAFTAE
jgi:chromosome segregation ATPase